MNLSYYWRVFTTGICFLVFGIGGIILSFSVFPILYIWPVNSERKKVIAQFIIYNCFRFFRGFVHFTGLWKFVIQGEENLDLSKGGVIIANHPTLVDIVILISKMPRAICVVKPGVWNNPVMMAAVRSAGYIPNHDTQQLLSDCIEAVKSGENLIIFPEGSRTRGNFPDKFHRGFANIALQSQKNITPILIFCNTKSLSKGRRWYQIPKKRKARMNIQIQPAQEISSFCKNNKNILVQSRELTKFLESYYKGKFNDNERSS